MKADEYIRRYCEQHGVDREETMTHAIVKSVIKSYEKGEINEEIASNEKE